MKEHDMSIMTQVEYICTSPAEPLYHLHHI
eukprot:jgi/Botrbrau1/15839/Bobra.40_1s0023.1